MRVERLNTQRYNNTQAFTHNVALIKNMPLNTFNKKMQTKNVNHTDFTKKVGAFFSKLINDFKKNLSNSNEIDNAKNKFTKENYLKSLLKKGMIEGKDYKVFDYEHYKAIEESDLANNIDRVIRLRKDGTISLIAEYNATTKKLMDVKKFDELGFEKV